jgi:hypothetical protein
MSATFFDKKYEQTYYSSQKKRKVTYQRVQVERRGSSQFLIESKRHYRRIELLNRK